MDIQQSSADRLGKSLLPVYDLETGYGYWRVGFASGRSKACLVFALVFVGIAVKSVPQDYEWTVESFGRYVRTLEPGLALLIPIVERIDAG
jgi:hypothetical protein